MARPVLLNSYPNPARSLTRIHYSLARHGRVRIKIYNPQGRLVRTLLDRKKQAGSFHVSWDGRNSKIARLASGVYICRLCIGRKVFQKRIVILQ
jgi:flagellar hook assembly protein FlgD